jgi:hypothetical protein
MGYAAGERRGSDSTDTSVGTVRGIGGVWERALGTSTDGSLATAYRIVDIRERRESVSSSSSLATVRGIRDDDGDVLERRGSVSTDSSVVTAFRVEDEDKDAVDERRPRVSTDTSPAGEQQRTQAGNDDPILRTTAQILAQRRQDAARSTSAPDQETEQRPSSVPPSSETPSVSQEARQPRHQGRVALGLALMLVRDRVNDETWRDGIDQMRERGEDVGVLLEIISLGLEARSGVRDV